ncbi:hypothetical protein [Streptomyces sp. NBC_00162]|uniref:hypothetical protein n=1 Tax=Streptomyces sp. NBC_00162 TaxID=2903629 RepID=UPI00214A9B8B|nr:hypothetical protein [Streptomyces sp. NBC_00162]UUU42025.1 hypothetical protein JIW86_26345 [Streptomyces sp. NBC_00162]
MKMKRAVGVLAVAVAATALPIVVAAPASADQGDCQLYLFDRGYNVGPKVESACGTGADRWNPAGWGQCLMGLTGIGVRQEHAVEACNAAKW